MKGNVLVIASFDILHYGHMLFLQKAAALSRSGKVNVALGTDEFQAEYKRPPVFPFARRRLELWETGLVSEVYARTRKCCEKIIDWDQSTILPFGSDWTDESFLEVNGIAPEFIEQRGITLVRFKRSGTMSTSEIIERIKDAE